MPTSVQGSNPQVQISETNLQTSKERRNSLAWVVVNKKEFEGKREECPICLNGLLGTKVITHGDFPHFYHDLCIRKAFYANRHCRDLCPECKLFTYPLPLDILFILKTKYDYISELPERISNCMEEMRENTESMTRKIAYSLFVAGSFMATAAACLDFKDSPLSTKFVVESGFLFLAASDFCSSGSFGTKNLCIKKTHVLGVALITCVALGFYTKNAALVAAAFVWTEYACLIAHNALRIVSWCKKGAFARNLEE